MSIGFVDSDCLWLNSRLGGVEPRLKLSLILGFRALLEPARVARRLKLELYIKKNEGKKGSEK